MAMRRPNHGRTRAGTLRRAGFRNDGGSGSYDIQPKPRHYSRTSLHECAFGNGNDLIGIVRHRRSTARRLLQFSMARNSLHEP